ncbi:MAG: CBS domain-containing protein, partial [Syntrophomonas sp.]
MTREVISAGPNDRIEDVVKILIDNKISGLPVVDGQG